MFAPNEQPHGLPLSTDPNEGYQTLMLAPKKLWQTLKNFDYPIMDTHYLVLDLILAALPVLPRM